MSLHEAYVDGLMWRRRLKACVDAAVIEFSNLRWVNFVIFWGGFEITWVTFNSFWSMLRREACANELVWRRWLKALEEAMSTQFFCRKISNFFVIFLVGICCLRFDFTWVIFITFGRWRCVRFLLWWIDGAMTVKDVQRRWNLAQFSSKRARIHLEDFFVILGWDLVFEVLDSHG